MSGAVTTRARTTRPVGSSERGERVIPCDGDHLGSPSVSREAHLLRVPAEPADSFFTVSDLHSHVG